MSSVRSMRSARALAAAAVLAAAACGAWAQNNFYECVAGSSGTTLRTANQPDFMYHVQNSIYPDPTPAYIAAVNSHEDVSAVMKCATQFGVEACVRSGGHDFVGSSSCDGVMVDLRALQGVAYNGGNQQITVQLGNTLGEMFYYTLENSGNSRVIGVGLCPSVGTGGYLLGGGHNPYAGKIGLTCDSMVSIKIVKPNGDVVVASPSNESELFWASCGGGGSAFGVAVEATLNTHDASPFHNNVYFRFTWPTNVAGEVIHKWLDYNGDNGDTWIRLEATNGGGMYGYGVCWNSGSTGDCFNRLSQHAFFNVGGRQQSLLVKANDVKDFQAFIGPAGDWANKVYSGSFFDAFVNKVYLERNLGWTRRYGSSFFTWPSGNKPPVSVIQAAVNSVASANGNVNWLIFQWNPFGAAIKNGYNNAFAHRNSGAFIELIGESANGGPGQAELLRIDNEVKAITRAWRSGVYVSYPEFGLQQSDFEYLYWGQNLQRLAYLRGGVDPTGTMTRLQGLPAGKLQCPGGLQVYTPAGPESRALQITGYASGQLADMRVVFSVSGGCGVNTGATSGANVQNNGDGTYYAITHTNAAFTIQLTGGNVGACSINTVEVNGIDCGGEVVNPPIINPNPTTPTTPTNPGTGSGTPVMPPADATCTPAGARCTGAAGFPAVPWLGGCCSGACVTAPDWGQWCPPTGDTPSTPTVTQAPVTQAPATGSGTPVMPPSDATCTPSGARCIGAPGFPGVPWLGGCCSGACVTAPDWGQWCPPTGNTPSTPTVTNAPPAATQAPATGSGTPVMPPADATCTPAGARCIGAPGFPGVPWLGGCCSGACVTAPDWGQWCPSTGDAPSTPTVPDTPATGGSSTPVMPPSDATCTPTGARCIGAPGFPAVPWLGGCCSGACVNAPDWGQWCAPN